MLGIEQPDKRKIVLLYSSYDLFREELNSYLKAMMPENDLLVSRSQDDLIRTLSTLPNDFIAVLFASSQKELDQLVSLKKHLRVARVILVLPDREKHNLSGGYQLQPRFLTFADGDLGEVKAVLGKMLSIG